MTIAIRVTPSSARTAVGGRRGDALVVRVTQAPVDGDATEAALRAVADALGVARRDLLLRTGASSRDKLVLVGVGPVERSRVARQLAVLMDGP
jgi:uncharacterized protein YggU (UPF0235/DUF167 family)